jgi:hypothetical protein
MSESDVEDMERQESEDSEDKYDYVEEDEEEEEEEEKEEEEEEEGEARKRCGKLLTVYNRSKLQVDLQADKSPIVVKGPFFPRVVNPRYQICGTNV